MSLLSADEEQADVKGKQARLEAELRVLTNSRALMNVSVLLSFESLPAADAHNLSQHLDQVQA